jgi:hypothetical protein
MYLDHPKITATKSDTEPDRIERINRVYGYAVGLADYFGNTGFIEKISQIHDHKGNLIIVWGAKPTNEEKSYFLRAWKSKVGDETSHVEHQIEKSQPD